MTVRVTVKGRFVYNGKTYGSLEELPENVRQAYEKAMAATGAGHSGGAAEARVKITFNGTEYESLDAMPPDERRVYESVVGAVEAGHVQPGRPGDRAGLAPGSGGGQEPALFVSAEPIEPGSATSRKSPVGLVLGLAILLLLLGYYLYTSAGPR
jgi:hypothetical protein